jgi:hypothetical protein
MKANELRIGNLVYLKSKDAIYEISSGHDIEEIDDAPINFDAKPISLTEEWLLKFGAKELNAKRGVLKEFVLKTVRIEMSNSGNFYYKNSKLILESVHQLQNIYFALTGKELTFKSE